VIAAFGVYASGAGGSSHRLLLLLAASALALVAGGELVYVRDAFAGTPNFRFNTVFKTGYEAWYLLAIVAGVGVWWTAARFGRRACLAFVGGFAVLAALGLVYPVLGTYSRSEGFSASPTLDGMRWLKRDAPDDAKAIAWLRRSIHGAPTIVETVGADYDPDGRGRVSTFTGLPTVVQWPGHELQWNHDPGRRARDVRRTYETTSARVARRLLDRYGVRLVFVGSLERRDFGRAGLAKFSRLGTVAFRSGRTVVYRISERRGSTAR